MFFQAHHSIDRNPGYYSTNDASSTIYIYIYIYIYKGRSTPLKQEEKKKAYPHAGLSWVHVHQFKNKKKPFYLFFNFAIQ
jgi:hypothetical protein